MSSVGIFLATAYVIAFLHCQYKYKISHVEDCQMCPINIYIPTVRSNQLILPCCQVQSADISQLSGPISGYFPCCPISGYFPVVKSVNIPCCPISGYSVVQSVNISLLSNQWIFPVVQSVDIPCCSIIQHPV